MMAGTLQHDGYSSHVITPVISWRDAILQIDLDRFGEIRGMQQELAVTAGSNSDPDVELDRGRHHETVVVVGVLANEVDATRSSADIFIPSLRFEGRATFAHQTISRYVWKPNARQSTTKFKRTD